jgi:hypothetical protein
MIGTSLSVGNHFFARRRTRRVGDRHLFIVTLMTTVFAFLGGFANASDVLPSGTAFGTYAYVAAGTSTTVLLAQTAAIARGCPTLAGTSTATLASVNHLPLISSATINDSVTTTSNSSVVTSDIQSVNLLGGLILANEVVAVSTTSEGSSGLKVSSTGTMFSDLAVLGLPVASNVAPNTTIQLPGFGKVVLNEQVPSVTTTTAALTIRMIHVYITTANVLNLAVGTQIVIGSVRSAIQISNGPGLFSGFSYGSAIAGAVASSPSAFVSLACAGTNGATITATAASVNVPLVLASGTISDAVEGNITPSLISGHTSSTLQSINLLNGLITVKALKVQANVSSTDGVHVTLNDTGTAFTQLVVLGHPEILDTVPANTKVMLAGIGVLYLHSTVVQSNAVDVYGIFLSILPGNTLGLPAQNITVGRSKVGIAP